MPGADGKLCPYHGFRPQSDEGALFWELIQRCKGQLRMAGMGGVIGFDLGAIFAAADAMGLERDIALALLPGAEFGMREGIAVLREREEADDKEVGE